MISNYNALTRKYIDTFGTMFNNLFISRVDSNNNELGTIQIPIDYASKEKYMYRIKQYLDLDKPIQIALPRMSYELTDLKYDSSRKQNTMLKQYTQTSGGTPYNYNTQYIGVPYNLSFSLFIYARNTTDALQIVEQLLPMFPPDRTITIKPIISMNFITDIPIILEKVEQTIDTSSDFEKTRSIIWTLTFTMKVWYYGPVTEQGVILEAITNIWDDTRLDNNFILKMNLNSLTSNNGFYKIGDTVYQGDNLEIASCTGKVTNWLPLGNNNTYFANTHSSNTIDGILSVTNLDGNFLSGYPVHSVTSNGTYMLLSFDSGPMLMAKIIVIPDPNIIPTINIGTYLSNTMINVIQMNMKNYSGNTDIYLYKDTVYQGNSSNTANAYGQAIYWNANTDNTGILWVAGSQGAFNTNTIIKALSSNASYTLESFSILPLISSTVISPQVAVTNHDFGFIENIEEFPNIRK